MHVARRRGWHMEGAEIVSLVCHDEVLLQAQHATNALLSLLTAAVWVTKMHGLQLALMLTGATDGTVCLSNYESFKVRDGSWNRVRR